MTTLLNCSRLGVAFSGSSKTGSKCDAPAIASPIAARTTRGTGNLVEPTRNVRKGMISEYYTFFVAARDCM